MRKYQIPITVQEYEVVFDAIPSGIIMLLRGTDFPWLLTPTDTVMGAGFSAEHQSNITKIRALFQNDITIPYIIPF